MEFSITEQTSFEWDETKRRINLLKHDIDFGDAILALQRPHVELPSIRNGEVRTIAICPDAQNLIAVVFTMRGEICRIISARAARKNEKQLYYDRYS